ncbi:MAG: LAGLIDADG family homing endonuclease [Candidatus Omnitrophica bacterium]|nr:LAGLIDADG family homing endonuclease [Candidatus Omnitrophota bacterium]MBU4472906.1 LAGLIDADG family homing endonuclease [Candidatus Omnitrophota bacterium]MCG2706154.1 LAGLIDADG family homing endonuclease [Candidatus Omnitrophota bacterium]
MPQKRKELNIEGSNLWYLVGLITSDGCLSSDGRHINITSKDYEFLRGIKNLVGLGNKIGTKNKRKINEAYYLQFSNRNLYEFLLIIGLTPNKSLTLTNLDIPEEYFVDFLRGLIDGDGSVRRWIHHTNLHEQWSLSIYSGSQIFITWLQSKIEKYLDCRGKIYSALRPQRKNFIYTLKYGKMGAKAILQNCYYQGAFGLDRKIKLAQDCFESHTGWTQSKTVVN